MADGAGVAIRTESLTKIYERKHIALNCVDLDVPTGAVLGVLGPNGAGKTTLVKLLVGLHVATAGRILMLGKSMSPNAAELRRRIGYLPADPKFPPGMTPIDYLDFVGRLSGMPRKERRPRLAALLRAVDLSRIAGEPVRQFSTGMRTRLAIAASLINDPAILVWDEPAQGLDPEARRTMLDLILSMAGTKTLVVCSHHLSDLQEVCTQTIVLHEGQVVFSGELAELRGAAKASDIQIEISGDKKEFPETIKSIQSFEEVETCSLTKNLLKLKIRDGQSQANTLANVLATLADHHLEMADLKVSGEETQEAIAKLLRQEGSRGLTRAYQTVDA